MEVLSWNSKNFEGKEFLNASGFFGLILERFEWNLGFVPVFSFV